MPRARGAFGQAHLGVWLCLLSLAGLPAGVYFARLTSGSVGVQTRVVLLP